MNLKRLIFGGLFFLVIGSFAILNLKSDELVLSARYQKLSCEKCYHMMVEKSQDPSLIGETIIPVSTKVDIEQMIDRVAINNVGLCLRGKLYLFNFNVFKIEPDGRRFEVISQENSQTCASI